MTEKRNYLAVTKFPQNPQVAKTTKTVYGDDASTNTKGQIKEQYDQSGKTLFNLYDFKGNLLSLSKQMTTDYKNIID